MLDPHIVVAELAINGHLVSNGAAYNQLYVTFFKFEGEKIKRYRFAEREKVSRTSQTG